MIEFDFKDDGLGVGRVAFNTFRRVGRRGTGVVKVDGKDLDSHPMAKSVPISIMWCETFNVGLDTGTPVDDKDYQVPFRFTGKISKLTVKTGPEQLSAADREKIHLTFRDRQ